MANTLTTLMHTMLARGVVYLRNTTVMPQLVNSDWGTEAKEKGDTIDVDIPQATTVVDVSPGVTPSGDNVAADSTSVKVPIALDKWKMSKPYMLSDKDMQEIDARNDFLPKKATMALDALASQVNSDILAEYTGIYGLVGTAGTTPFVEASPATSAHEGTRAMQLARKVLAQQKCPSANRRFVMDPDAAANATGLPAFKNAEKFGDRGVILNGEIGYAFGMDVYEELQVPTHTAGSITTGAVAKASTAQAIGLKTVVCTTAASTGAVDFNVGDIITFAGSTQQHTVTTAVAEASAATDFNLAIEPGLAVALAGSEALTLTASHVVNLAFNRDAFAFVNRPIADTDLMRGSGQIAVRSVQDPVSGINLRLEIKREHKRTVWEFDILYGVKLVHPELACRVAG